MADTFVEVLVEKRTPGYAGAVKIFLIIAAVCNFLLGVMNVLFWVLALVAIILLVVMVPGFHTEYEYTFIGDQLNIDRIINKSKRKKISEIEMERVELIAPAKHRDIEGFANNPSNKGQIYNYSSYSDDQSGLFGMISYGTKGKKLVYFEPNEKLINALYYQSPRKVVKSL